MSQYKTHQAAYRRHERDRIAEQLAQTSADVEMFERDHQEIAEIRRADVRRLLELSVQQHKRALRLENFTPGARDQAGDTQER